MPLVPTYLSITCVVIPTLVLGVIVRFDLDEAIDTRLIFPSSFKKPLCSSCALRRTTKRGLIKQGLRYKDLRIEPVLKLKRRSLHMALARDEAGHIALPNVADAF